MACGGHAQLAIDQHRCSSGLVSSPHQSSLFALTTAPLSTQLLNSQNLQMNSQNLNYLHGTFSKGGRFHHSLVRCSHETGQEQTAANNKVSRNHLGAPQPSIQHLYVSQNQEVSSKKIIKDFSNPSRNFHLFLSSRRYRALLTRTARRILQTASFHMPLHLLIPDIYHSCHYIPVPSVPLVCTICTLRVLSILSLYCLHLFCTWCVCILCTVYTVNSMFVQYILQNV